MRIKVDKKTFDAIAKSARGVVPPGIKMVANYVKPKTYVSTSPSRNRLGNTYTKVGPVSVLTKNSTPASQKQATASRKATTTRVPTRPAKPYNRSYKGPTF